jgi:hypothetical protein
MILYGDAAYAPTGCKKLRSRFSDFIVRSDKIGVYRFLCALTLKPPSDPLFDEHRTCSLLKPFILALRYEFSSDNSYYDKVRRGVVYSKDFKFAKYEFDGYATLPFHDVEKVVNLMEDIDSRSMFRIYVV